jgi:integrase
MRGSVRKRGSTYTWYLFTPEPVTGQRRQHSKGGYRTKKECQAALNDALAALRVGTFVESSKRTVASYLLDEWLPAMQPPRVRPSTWLSYQRNLERHVIPALGTIELQRLTPAHLTGFYRSLLTGGRLDGRGGLSVKSVKNIHGALHPALKDAVRWGYVARNVADAADPPKVVTPEMQVWSPAQLRTFLTHVRDDRLYAAWMLFATTGMRRGEVAGLRWVDVDLAAGRVTPRKPRVEVNYKVHVSEPKTAKGKRSLALDPATAAALREHRARQAEERLIVGPGWQDSGLVFTWGTAARSTRSGSRAGSSGSPVRRACPRSGCMTCATATPRPRSRPVCPPRSSASASATPTSPSPWIPIATCCPAWMSVRPALWPG